MTRDQREAVALEPDDDPAPFGWRLCGDPVWATEAQATRRAILSESTKTPGQRKRLKRDAVIVAAHVAGFSTRDLAGVFGLAHSYIHKVCTKARLGPQTPEDPAP